MTTFVPLSQDSEGAVSCTSLGDWILAIIKIKNPSRTALYYSKLLNQFQEVDGEQVIKDAYQLFELFLSEHTMIFEFLSDARESGAAAVPSIDPEQQQIRMKYSDVLKQVDEYFTVLMYMLQLRFTSSSLVEKAGTLLMDAICNGDDFLDLRLRLLQMLYNSIEPTWPLRIVVYIQILEFAAKHGIFRSLLPIVFKIDEWMKDWIIDKERKVYIYHFIATQLHKLGFDRGKAYEYYEKRVEACDDLQYYSISENIRASADFVVYSIMSPHILYFDRILMMPAVAYLANTSEYFMLVELLGIFIKGSCADLDTFLNKHGKAIEQLSIPQETCRDKIKLLSLAGLCCGKSNVEIEVVKKELNIMDDNTIEHILVRAITSGVLDALIDQKSKCLIIKCVMQRHFDKPQLQQLHENLLLWKNSLDHVVEVLSNGNATF